jgi:hypothetical protein
MASIEKKKKPLLWQAALVGGSIAGGIEAVSNHDQNGMMHQLIALFSDLCLANGIYEN